MMNARICIGMYRLMAVPLQRREGFGLNKNNELVLERYDVN